MTNPAENGASSPAERRAGNPATDEHSNPHTKGEDVLFIQPCANGAFDTSGHVRRPGFAKPLGWTDLDAFEQGYVEAMLAPREGLHYSLTGRFAGFSDLAPEALATILRDCSAALGDRFCGYGENSTSGAMFWRDRRADQLNGMEPRFPPLTPHLDAEGKVQLSDPSR